MTIPLIIALSVLGTVVLMVVLLGLSSKEKKIEYEIEPLYGVADPQFRRAVGSLLGPGIVAGNRVGALINGDQIFPAMLAAIRSAQRSITFETYIYWSGDIGKEFTDALSDRARAGVKVHLMMDWVGSAQIRQKYVEEMEEAGVEVERYHPLRWYTLARMNNRTHRKVLVVDGRIGFTGGVGIADKWTGDAQSEDHWRDSHFRLEGPAVAQMQSAFMDNWVKTRSSVLHGDEYFPELPPVGPSPVQVFRSSPREGSESMRLMYLLSIASARRSIRLANSYFVPDDLSVAELVAARERGVDVQIIVPGPHIDAKVTRRASRSRWGPLLAAGCEIFEYQPTMYHCKVMIVDEIWTSVGSTNFDNRSFRLNDESNMNVLDTEFARGQLEVFERDKAKSRQVTLEEWARRPWTEKVREFLAGLLRAQL